MSLELNGKLVKLLPVQSGESARGPWKKQEMIIETNEQYPKKVAITCWGDKVDEIQNLAEGTNLQIAINVESREFNERWYTDVRAWKIDVQGAAPTNTSAPEPTFTKDNAPIIENDETEGDLPF